ncbi:MAG: hypothetical protein PVJ15_00400 [Gammaproteobacteria bacterium]|jgi:hypothetical protein
MKNASLIKIVLVTFIAILQIPGCANLDSIKPDTGEGSKVTIFRHGYDEIWNAAIDVVGSRLTIVESDKSRGLIKAEAKESTFGEVVGVFITPTTEGEKKYIVEVLALLKNRPQVPGQDSEPVFINALKARLD